MSNWITKAIEHPGAFTQKAKAAGLTIKKFATKVLRKSSSASPTTKKQANLAKTLSKMKHG